MNRTLVCVGTTEHYTRRLAEVAAGEGDRLLLVTHVRSLDAVDSLLLDVQPDPDAAAAAVLARCGERPVSAVLTDQELFVVPAAILAAGLGVAADPREAADAARDKARMKELWQAAGVATPTGRRFGSQRELAYARFDYPVVVKPVAGFGSCGVRRVGDERELAEQVRKISLINATTLAGSGSTGFLVEQCLSGPEYCVDTVWVDGRPVLDCVLARAADRDSSGPYYPDRVYTLGDAVPGEVRAAVLDLAHRAIRALGISRGPTHTEVKFDGGTPYVLEAAARPGAGGAFYELARQAYGTDMLRAVYLSLVCGSGAEFDRRWGRPAPQPVEEGVTYFWYNLPYEGSGLIASLTGLDALRARPEVLLATCYSGPGDYVDPDDLNAFYLCTVMGRHAAEPGSPDLEALLKAYDDLVEVVF
ncbi:ATP-grasp domain-containing protein [Microbispora sp. CA-102843]|uniref:ATP-grasp domain-containing protein n=1 Tax=Microbispora sp. CA-102843 TaxID=3239952 RepID=UPI003D8EB6E6